MGLPGRLRKRPAGSTSICRHLLICHLLLLVVASRCLGQSVGVAQDDDDNNEPLIVINSMHSTRSGTTGGQHQAGRIRSPTNNSFVPSKSNHYLNHNHNQYQPSQEFDSDRFINPYQQQQQQLGGTRSNYTTTSHHNSNHNHRARPPPQQQPVDGSAQLKQRAPLPPIRDSFFHTGAQSHSQHQQPQQQVGSGVSAPYALPATATSGGGNHLATMVTNQHQRAPSFTYQPQQQQQQQAAPVSLIRDTSQLVSDNEQFASAGDRSASSFNSINHDQLPTVFDSNKPGGLLWVQSIRDNHAGPLRSRFDLLTSSSAGGASSAQVSNFGLPGPNLHAPRPLGDALIKSKWPPATPTHLQLEPTAWQLQAKAARGQMGTSPATTTTTTNSSGGGDSGDLGNLESAARSTANLRRNSKFTREAEQTTTPLSSVETTTATTSNKTTASPEEPATGNGQVLPVSETDLLLLGQKFEVDSRPAVAPSGVTSGKLTNESGASQSAPLLFSNNHSTKGKPQKRLERVTTAELPAREQSSPRRLGRQLDTFDQPTTTRFIQNLRTQAVGGGGGSTTPQARAGWSGMLPALLQRTLGGLLRRLTGTAASSQQPPVNAIVNNKPQQQQQHPLEQTRGQSFVAGATAAQQQQQQQHHNSLQLDSLLASAISAAAAVASQKPANQNSFVLANSGESGKQPTMAGQIDESGASAAAVAPTMQTRAKNPSLRQHANKKIIDSFVDLPASERRSSNTGAMGKFHGQAGNFVLTDSPAVSPLDLRAEPRRVKRAVADGDSEESISDGGLESDEGAVEDREGVATGNQDYADQATEPQARVSSHAAGTPISDSRGRGYIRPTETHMELRRAPAAGRPDEDEPIDSSEHEIGADAAEVEDDLRPRVGDDDTETAELTSSESAQVEGDDLQAEASTDDESHSQTIGFYAPQASLLTGSSDFTDPDALASQEEEEEGEPSESTMTHERRQDPDDEQEQLVAAAIAKKRKQVRSTQRPASKYKNHERRTQIRRPPVAPPIEPPLPAQMGAGHQSIMPPRRRNNQQQQQQGGYKRTRPPSALHLRPSSAQQPQSLDLGVPHLDLNGVRSSLLGSASLSSSLGPTRANRPKPHKTESKSPAPKPLSVLVPGVQMAEGGDAPHSSLMSPMSSSINVMDLDPSMTRLAHNKLIVAKFKPRRAHNKPKAAATSQQVAQQPRSSTPRHWEPPVEQSSGGENLERLDRESRPTEPTPPSVASLASAVLGSRVITNKHISDIISRWTRPVTSSAPNQRLSTSTTSAPATSTSTTTTTNTQAPASQQQVSASTQPNGDSAEQMGDEVSLNGRVQQVTKPRPPLDLLLAHAQANPPINRNDKFNFSMASMNNRERINPLIFPIDLQNRLAGTMANNASISSVLNKMKQPARAKFSTTTTTTTSTTTTTTTTRRPVLVRTSSSPNSFNHYHHQRPLNKVASSTTSTTTSTTPRPSVPIVDLEPLVNLEPLPEDEEYPAASSTTTRRPPTQEIFLAPTKPIQYKPKFKPALVIESLDHLETDDNYIGQIVRNQHHHQRHRDDAQREQQTRLRNQYLALVGGGRSSSENSTVLSGSDQPGTVGQSWLLAPNQPTLASRRNATTADESNVEEAAHEANRYVTLTREQAQADASEHSIVIMSDNHKHLRRRPPQSHAASQQHQQMAAAASAESDKFLYHNNHNGAGAPATRPPPLFASMHYSSQAMLDFADSTTTTTTTTTTLAPATSTSAASQLARKYLEEFVNGTRVRPSSLKFTTTTMSPPSTTTSGSVQQTAGDQQQQPVDQQFTTNNHSRGPQPVAGKTGSQEALGKLDQQAHELLLDLFDRDPAYSASLIAAHQHQSSRAPPAAATGEDLEHSAKGDKLRRIYEQLMQNSANNRNNNNKMSGKRQPPPVSDNPSKSSSETTVGSTAPPTTTEMPSTASDAAQSTANLQDQHQARSTDSASEPGGQATTPIVPRFENFRGGPAATSGANGDQGDSNNRASMRKNQAKIQAILQDLARRNATAAPRTTTTEPQDALDLNELASHAQFVRPTAGPASEQQESSVTASALDQQTPSSAVETLSGGAASDSADSDQQDDHRSTTTTTANFNDNNNLQQDDDLSSLASKTTRFYAPALTSTTMAGPTTTYRPTTQTQHHRYPIIDTLSAGRQKINKPIEGSPDGGYHSHSSSQVSSTTIQYEHHPSTTSKLTESVSNNQELRQTIRNRATSSTTPIPSMVGDDNNLLLGGGGGGEENALATTGDEDEQAAGASDQAAASENLTTSGDSDEHLPVAPSPPLSHKLTHKRRRPAAHQHTAGDGGVDGAPYMQAPFERPGANEPHESRPIIIRRKPSRRPAGTPTSSGSGQHRNRHQPVRISLSDHSSAETTISVAAQKPPAKNRRKKPSSEQHKRPSMTLEPVVFGELPAASSGSNRPKAPPTLILRPGGGESGGSQSHQPAGSQLIRKRPSHGPVRLPPNNIRIHEQQKQVAGGDRSQLILPLESVIKRKHQDIRTRPLTIIDGSPPSPLTSNMDQSSSESSSDPQRTGTTILHKNMVVTYKPGRPLPGSGYHAHQGSHRYPTTPTPPSSATIFIHSAATTHHQSQRPSNATTFEELPDGTLVPSRVQLGSGNGGDTLLVSIEQQQAQQAAQQQQQANRRPPARITFDLNETASSSSTATTTSDPLGGSSGPTTESTSGMTSPTTNSPSTLGSLGTTTTTTTTTTTGAAATTSNSQQPSHPRPIIVINGLTLDPTSGNLVPAGSGGHHQNSTSGHSHHSHKTRPLAGSRPSGNSLIESGSVTVVASASHGSNSSRPLFGRPHMGSGNSSSSSTTSASNSNQTSGSSQDSTGGLEGNPFTMSSQQTADSVVGPEMPNFGGSSSSSSFSSGHIGMPHFGSLPTSSKPPGFGSGHHSSGGGGGQRPYSWRVRKRPNGNGNGGSGSSSHAPYDYHTSGSSATLSLYRPQSLAQLFSWSSITGAFDNLQIILARMRTFLISIMVMFLPPIALTASIVNAMSS